MKIFIDARHICGNIRGIGYFVRYLLKYFSLLDKDNEYYLLVKDITNATDLKLGANFHLLKSRGFFGFEDLFVMPVIINFIIRPDVVWFSANNCSPFISKKIRVISSIHDIMFYTQKYKFLSKQYFGALYRKLFSAIAIRRADRIHTLTKYNIKKIADFFGTSMDRFFYSYDSIEEGVDYSPSILPQLGLTKGTYFYTITGTSYNKNLTVLLKAYKHFCEKYGNNYQLVITGVRSSTANDGIIFTDYISTAEKKSLLANCAVFLFLSRDEGFGVPPLEAINERANILLTDIPNFRELYQGYCHFTVVDDVEKIAEDLFSTLKNPINYNSQTIFSECSWDRIAKIFLQEFRR